MDSNDIIENLWHEAVTIRAAVASAYEAVGGDGPLPASLVQALNYITAHASAEGCGPGSSCVTDSVLNALASAVGVEVLEDKQAQTEAARDAVYIASERSGGIAAALDPTASPASTLTARVDAAKAALEHEFDNEPVWFNNLSGALTGSTTTGGLDEARTWFAARDIVAESALDNGLTDNKPTLGEPPTYSITSILATLLTYVGAMNKGASMANASETPPELATFPGFVE